MTSGCSQGGFLSDRLPLVLIVLRFVRERFNPHYEFIMEDRCSNKSFRRFNVLRVSKRPLYKPAKRTECIRVTDGCSRYHLHPAAGGVHLLGGGVGRIFAAGDRLGAG